MFAGLVGIGTVGELFDQSLECIVCLSNHRLVPVDGVQSFEITKADLINNIRNGLIAGVKAFKGFICKNRFIIRL